jgi:hypothetical protein
MMLLDVQGFGVLEGLMGSAKALCMMFEGFLDRREAQDEARWWFAVL